MQLSNFFYMVKSLTFVEKEMLKNTDSVTTRVQRLAQVIFESKVIDPKWLTQIT